MENNQPVNPTWWQILWKLWLWLLIWIILSAFIFVMFILLGSTIDEAVKNSVNHLAFSPLVWLSFLGIWILWSIIWNLILAMIYSLIWQEDYYDVKLMSSSILSVNLLLLVPFLFMYFFVWAIVQDIKILFLVFGFHLFFSVYVSLTVIDLVKNPNYSAVYVIGNSVWFIWAVLFFLIVFFVFSWPSWEVEKNVLFFPPLLSFSLIPFFSTVFEKIYYKFYEMWNDFLYIPSISEVLVDEEEADDVNVDIK